MKFWNAVKRYFASVNWRVRARNKAFWLALVPAVCLLVQAVCAVFGLTLDLSGVSDRIANVVKAAFVLLTLLGIVTDPTTAGLSDSRQAMGYETPREDGEEGSA